MRLNTAWTKATDWALARSTRPPARGRSWALIVLGCLILAIGLADFVTDTRISLTAVYVVPVILAVAWLGWRAAIAVAAGTVIIRVIGDYVAIDEESLPFWDWWNSSAELLILLFVVWLFHHLLSLHRQLERRVVDRTKALTEAAKVRRQLEQELLAVGSRERNSFGQELHDDIGQHLVGTAMAAKVLANRLSEQNHPLAAEAQAIVGWLEEGANKTRRLARGLLLSEIAPENLGEKLAELAEEGSTTGVPCRFRIEGDTLVSDAGTAAQLFRIAQEAMRNALKHADPRHVDISLVGDAHAICLMVEDDGRGLPQSVDQDPGMGLRIMSHRAAYIGGTLSIIPTPAQGTRIICYLPRMRRAS